MRTELSQPVPAIQRKLTVGPVDDPMEKEADDMAGMVMRMPEAPFAQRKCTHCDGEEKINRQPEGEEDQPHFLPPVPHYQLHMPRLGESSGFGASSGPGGSRFGHFQPFRPSLRPFFQYIPPIRVTLTPAEMYRILGLIGGVRVSGTGGIDLSPNIPPAPESSDDGVRLGGDQFRDIITGNNQVSAVARGLDFGHFRIGSRLVDVFHEPTITWSAGTPGGGTDNSTQFGLAILNIHLPHNIELAPLQVGADTGAGVTFGSQLEIHTPDPHWSTFINFGYSIKPGERGNYQFDSTGLSLSFFPHFLNP